MTGISARRLAAGAVAALLLVAAAPGGGAAPRPGPGDKCPVCGMFVAKYPDWVAGVTFKDGHTAWFDGAKDFFKFLQHPERYGQPGAAAEVARLWVSDYYAVALVDARAAYFVQGSDVYGPMGVELVPFERREDAEEFKKDHHGSAVLRFSDVSEATIRQLQDPG